MTDQVHPLAERLIGIPYLEGGRIVDASGGADCLGVALHWVRLLGFQVEDPWAELERSWREKDGRDANRHASGCGWEEIAGPELGAVAVCEAGSHVAPYVGGGYVVHARSGQDSVLGQARKLPEDTRWYRPLQPERPSSRSPSPTTSSGSSTTRGG